MKSARSAGDPQALRQAFGRRLRENVALAPYTSARIGGPAEYLLTVRSAQELEQACRTLWELDAGFRILGGGSNVLVADAGARGVTVLNQAKDVRFDQTTAGPRVTAESGASLGSVARRSIERGLGGLEWAATIPGTVGGAIVGNAGAHGGDVSQWLEVAGILQRSGQRESWDVGRLDYAYRTSWLKTHPGQAIVLDGTFRLEPSTRDAAKARAAEYADHRRRSQPPGASWGSMFKNPPGDFAGRLIEAAGLKGAVEGKAQISPQHANFFINLGGATAAEVWSLVQRAKAEVARRTGVELELEIELFGDWPASAKGAGAGAA